MYLHNSQQTTFSDNSRLFGGLPLDKDNRWVKLAGIIPWDLVENEYRKHFKSKRGGVAKSARLALGCLIAKEMLQLSDRDTVAMIRENPYIQYFLGYSCYQYKISLDPSLLTHFRKRFPADIIKLVNQWVIEADINSDSDSGDDESQTNSLDTCDKDAEKSEESGNRGTLILDATCAPQDIQYPTDVRLLHESRLKLELMMDTLQAGRSAKKPRNYRRKANKEYQRFCRNRRPRKNVIRQAVCAQRSASDRGNAAGFNSQTELKRASIP